MNIIFDLDSTLVTIEGINELGALKDVRHQIEILTQQAMNGALSMDQIFLQRLEIICPRQKDLDYISKLYLENITPNAQKTIAHLKKDHRVFMVTGGYDVCAYAVANELDIKHTFANQIIFDQHGNYAGLNQDIPLWKNGGKKIIVDQIRKEYPDYTIMVGDGIGDYEVNADAFFYFSGIVKRETVAQKADYVIDDLWHITSIIETLSL